MAPSKKNISTNNNIFWLCLFSIVNAFSQQKTINSGWQFSQSKNTWETINIPHTWNKTDAFDDAPGYRRGIGYYKKRVFIASEEKEKSQFLKFNAVNQKATVFINGEEVGNHKGGYAAFNFDISKFIHYGAYNVIEVTVDNSHCIDIPPLDADFTFYGGIYRDVQLISLPKQHFSLEDYASDGFYVHYTIVNEKKAKIDIDILLENKADKKSDVVLNIQLLDDSDELVDTYSKKITLKANTSNTIKADFSEIKNQKLWSPDHPYLYHLKLTLFHKNGGVLDSKNTNIGFRWASVDPEKGFFLNGRPTKLIGVNRHQDYEGFGNAVPTHLQKKDIEMIRNMGANVIRFAHYPHARALYDLCDELGILVWTEIPIVNKVTDSKAFFDTCINMQKEHIKQYYNHPSVVMFGYMNEIFLRLAFDKESTEKEKLKLKEATLQLATHLENLTQKLAPTHITVMACHLNEVYNDTGIADLPMLLGWNLYFGWYDKDIPDLGVFLDEQHKRYPNRPLLLSEYGPGADARIFTTTPKKFDFSTNYQAKLHQSYYQQITERPYMAGMTAWNFADFGSEFRGDAIPHVNQKGLVQYDRKPKDIYYWYRSVLNIQKPFTHVAIHNLSGLTLFGNETYPVQLFSNQSHVTVFLNDKKWKNIRIKNGFTTLNMPFKNGVNTIKVVSAHLSEEETVEVLRIDHLDFKNFNRFGINIGAHFYFKDQERKLTFVPDQAYKKGWFGYANGNTFNINEDKHQGIPFDIKNTTSEPLFQTMLEGCTTYKIDIPNGRYNIQLFFVEPQIKSTKNIYNLSETNTKTLAGKRRIFDVYLNHVLIEKQLDIANAYPEKYGVTISAIAQITNNEGLTISLKPIEGQDVISGVLIEKLN